MPLLKIALICIVAFCSSAVPTSNLQWQKLSEGPWSAREGLMAVNTPKGIFMTGGRDTFGSKATGDVWFSVNGSSWEQMPKPPFPARAYHAMFYHNDCLFVMGGQKVSFIGNPFYNDVWRSCDGAQTWKSLGNAPWKTRAGIAFETFGGKMVIAGGCFGGSIGNSRKFLNDVWASSDGVQWEMYTVNASWSARSGARLVALGSKLLLVAGEVGFTPDTQDGDIWSSADGKNWELVTEIPGWSKRSGHGVVNTGGQLLVMAGWHDNKCLHDLWSSSDGKMWTMLSNTTWQCSEDSCGKFDFWPVVTQKGVLTVGGSNAYSTFGKMWKDTWLLSGSLATNLTSLSVV